MAPTKRIFTADAEAPSKTKSKKKAESAEAAEAAEG
jgi:hypothetical protein